MSCACVGALTLAAVRPRARRSADSMQAVVAACRRRAPLKAAPAQRPLGLGRAGQRAERRRHVGRRTSPGWTKERRGARLGPQRKPTACRPRVSRLQRERSRAPGCPGGASSPRCARLLVVSGRIGALGADCARPVRAGGAGRAGRGRLLVLDLAQRVGPRLAAICGARGTHGERRWGGSLVKGTDRRSPSSRVRSAPPLRFPRAAPDTPDLRGVSIGLIRRATRWFAARWMRRNDALHDGAGAGGLTWRRCRALASGSPARQLNAA